VRSFTFLAGSDSPAACERATWLVLRSSSAIFLPFPISVLLLSSLLLVQVQGASPCSFSLHFVPARRTAPWFGAQICSVLIFLLVRLRSASFSSARLVFRSGLPSIRSRICSLSLVPVPFSFFDPVHRSLLPGARPIFFSLW
jgi:hypothetical protein